MELVRVRCTMFKFLDSFSIYGVLSQRVLLLHFLCGLRRWCRAIIFDLDVFCSHISVEFHCTENVAHLLDALSDLCDGQLQY